MPSNNKKAVPISSTRKTKESLIESSDQSFNEKLEEEVQQTKTQKNRSVTMSHKISIASLILIAVNIITTILFGLYQQKNQQEFQFAQQEQNERFQEQFLEFQQDLNTAKISVETSPDKPEEYFYISNRSNVDAKNIRIAVGILVVFPHWDKIFTSIKYFDIQPLNSAIVVTKEYQNINNYSSIFPIEEGNVITINIDKVSRSEQFVETFHAILLPPPNESMIVASTEQEMFIAIDKKSLSENYTKEDVDKLVYDLSSNFIDSKLTVATADMDVVCGENCIVTNNVYGIDFRFSRFPITLKAVEVLETTQGYIKVKARFSLNYLILEGEELPNIPYWIKSTQSNTYSVITKNDFESIK
jgi:hypothetical protein